LGFIFALFALMQILGAHWAILQTTAWLGMLVSYSQSKSIERAAAETFDGRHPCAVCTAVEQGKKQEQKRAPVIQDWLKKDFLFASAGFRIFRESKEYEYTNSNFLFKSQMPEPVVPPPRAMLTVRGESHWQ
jgi:hypothetical protein